MLIEAVVAIALVAIAIVAIVADLANAEKATAAAQNQATLDANLRYVSDYLRSHAQAAYTLCATTTTYSVPNPPAPAPALNPSNPVNAVVRSTSATRDGNAVTPLQTCSDGSKDFGIQEITITQSLGGITETRTVWKAAP